MDYNNDIDHVLVSEEEINMAVTRIAYEIEQDYKNSDKKLLLIGILKGSVIFMADILKKLNIPMETDYIKVSSYGSGTTTSGTIKLKADPDRTDLSGYNVVVIEDILDTGNTLSWLLEHLEKDLKDLTAYLRLYILICLARTHQFLVLELFRKFSESHVI